MVARVLVSSAMRREETRGCHWREDHADRDDTAWQRHFLVTHRPPHTLHSRTTETAAFPATTAAPAPETEPNQ